MKVTNTSCDLCVKEYIATEAAKLANSPLDQKKTNAIQRILRSAKKACQNVVIELPCDFGKLNHYICEKHLYKMIDAIKEYEDECNDR